MKRIQWKVVVGILFLVQVQPAFCVDWEIIGQKSKVPEYSGSEDMDLKVSVGEHTIRLLEAAKIPYKGDASGILSILGTPTGNDAIVVESNERMRVYGWCYTVDGKGPSVMADKFFFPSQKSKLSWFFAFSVYDHGNWIDCCTPAYLKPLNDEV